MGTDYADEDVTWTAWEAICQLYFPHAATTAGGVKYLVRREAYRGMAPASTWQHKPDVVVVRLTAPTLGADGLSRSVRRDILWVECKAPKHDQPNRWDEVMKEATERLSVAHPNRNVWLILATGLKWMVFYWDPNSPPQNPPLQIISHNQQMRWAVDRRIHVAPIQGQRHILQNGIIRTDLANTLDFWTQTQVPGQPPQPANFQSCMQFLENIILAVQTGNYNAANPPTMS